MFANWGGDRRASKEIKMATLILNEDIKSTGISDRLYAVYDKN